MSSRLDVPPFRWRDIVNVQALAFVLLVIVVYVALAIGLARVLLSPTGQGDQYIVLLPPWAGVDRIYQVSTAVDGRVIGLNDKANAYLLYVKRPGAVDALYRAGAWLVLDPTRVGGILACGPVPQRRASPALVPADSPAALPTPGR